MRATIRLARMSDVHDIARLTSQLGYEVPQAAAAARLARILPKDDQHFLVADYEAHPIGWVHAVIADYVETGRFVNIAGLVVDREHRGIGIGGLLMQHAEQWARERGCAVVRLTSSTGRTAAHRFYEHLGYTNIKMQFAFAKFIDTGERQDLAKFVPRIEP